MDDNTSSNATQIHGLPNNYALNGKIMLCSVIVLFVVVFFIACFHSYARWCLDRRQRSRRLDSLLSLSSARPTNSKPSNQGLDPSLLKILPTFVFPTAANSGPAECAVCLSEFEAGEHGRLLPKCCHVFHVQCIDMWFQSHSSCPLCRAPVKKDSNAQSTKSAPLESIAIVIDPPAAEPEMGRRRDGETSSETVGLTVEMPLELREERLRGVVEMGNGSTKSSNGSSNSNNDFEPKSPLKRIWSI